MSNISIYVVRYIELENDNIECIWLKIIMNNKRFYFCYAYRPPNTSVEFWELLNESIEKVKYINFPNFFLVGEFNDNYFIENCHLRNLINNCNLTQIIDEPTRVPLNTLLDIIVTNAPSLISKHGILAPICSDHKPIYACLKFPHDKTQSFKRMVWDFKNANFDLFREKLLNTNWDFIDEYDNIDTITDMFTEKFIEVAKFTILKKECYIRGKDKPWMHNEIRKQIRIRRKVHRIAKRVNIAEYWLRYRTQRNKVTSLVRKNKENYSKRLADNINLDTQKSSKSWWKLCKYFILEK